MRFLQPEFPFRPARLPFYYGWLILVVATLAMLMSIPGQTMGVSVFTDSLMEATGLSRVALSNAYLVGTILSGSLLPYGGVLLDRFGARLVTIGASLGLAATLCYLAVVDRIAEQLAGLVGLVDSQLVATLALIFGFFALRFTGQGMLTLVSRTLLGRWFDRLRGIVSGISGPFVSFGFALAPLLLAAWIDAAGWRGAWIGIAGTVGVSMSVLGWLVFRDTPEECGLEMDGRPPRASAGSAEHQTNSAPAEHGGHAHLRDEPRYGRSQAMHTLAFWAVAAPMTLQGLSVTGITFHIVDLGAERGLDRVEAVGIFPFIAVVSVVTALTIGWLTNHVRLQFLLVFMLIAQGIGVACAAHLGDPIWRFGAIVGLGASGGCFGPLSNVALPRFFGRLHLGAISSVMLMCIVWGSALGPSVLALSRDLLASYEVALYLCAAASLPAIALALLAPTPPLEPSR